MHRGDGLAIEKRKKPRDIVFNVRESDKRALRRRAFGQFIDPEWREAIGLMMTAIDLWACSATDLRTAYASGAVSLVQVKAAALEQAQRSAARWASGSPSGPLDGNRFRSRAAWPRRECPIGAAPRATSTSRSWRPDKAAGAANP